MSILSRFRKSEEIIIDVQFGAYYSIKTSEGYNVIRLLDLPGDSYHYQIIGSVFFELPTFEVMIETEPSLLHVPVEIAALIGKEITHIGHQVLTDKDLVGYRVYLEEMGVDDESINKHFNMLTDLSRNEPDKIRIYQDRDGVFGEYL